MTQKRRSRLIIDEAQKFPELFSYIQEIADTTNQKGQFILSRSQNFLLNERITQSPAGRVDLVELRIDCGISSETANHWISIL